MIGTCSQSWWQCSRFTVNSDRIYTQGEHSKCWQMNTRKYWNAQLTSGRRMWTDELTFARIGITATKGDETFVIYRFEPGFANPAMTSLWPTRPWLTGTNDTAINKCLKSWDHSSYRPANLISWKILELVLLHNISTVYLWNSKKCSVEMLSTDVLHNDHNTDLSHIRTTKNVHDVYRSIHVMAVGILDPIIWISGWW